MTGTVYGGQVRRTGEANTAQRAKCSDFEHGDLVGEVRKNLREPAQGRESSKKDQPENRLVFCIGGAGVN